MDPSQHYLFVCFSYWCLKFQKCSLRVQGRMQLLIKNVLSRVLTLPHYSGGPELLKSFGFIDSQRENTFWCQNNGKLAFRSQCHIFRFGNKRRSSPGAPKEDPRTTPGRPQGDPKGPSTNPAPKGHRGSTNLDFSLVLIGKVDPGGCCRHRPGQDFWDQDSLKPTRTLKL